MADWCRWCGQVVVPDNHSGWTHRGPWRPWPTGYDACKNGSGHTAEPYPWEAADNAGQ